MEVKYDVLLRKLREKDVCDLTDILFRLQRLEDEVFGVTILVDGLSNVLVDSTGNELFNR